MRNFLAGTVLLAVLVLSGCADDAPVSDRAARLSLETALSSWNLGHPMEEFEKEHPDMEFQDPLEASPDVSLLRYRIGRHHLINGKHVFSVQLVMTDKAGHQTRERRIYEVGLDRGRWVVNGKKV